MGRSYRNNLNTHRKKSDGLSSMLHGSTNQNTAIFVLTVIRTSNLTQMLQGLQKCTEGFDVSNFVNSNALPVSRNKARILFVGLCLYEIRYPFFFSRFLKINYSENVSSG